MSGLITLKVAWARYGQNGFMLKNSLSKTHLYDWGRGGRTRCGLGIPQAADEASVIWGNAAGAGPCKRCF